MYLKLFHLYLLPYLPAATHLLRPHSGTLFSRNGINFTQYFCILGNFFLHQGIMRIMLIKFSKISKIHSLSNTYIKCQNFVFIAYQWKVFNHWKLNDSIISIFLITVLLINCGDGLEALKTEAEFLDVLSTTLDQIEEDDICDFLDLGIQYRKLSQIPWNLLYFGNKLRNILIV